MATKTKRKPSVEKQLKEMLDIFSDRGAWIQGSMAVDDAQGYNDAEGYNSVEPKSKKAVAFCFVGAARRVGDGLELLSELTQSVVRLKGFDELGVTNPFLEEKFDRDLGITTLFPIKPKNKSDLEEVMISFNDDTETSVGDVRRLIRNALKRVQKAKEKK